MSSPETVIAAIRTQELMRLYGLYGSYEAIAKAAGVAYETVRKALIYPEGMSFLTAHKLDALTKVTTLQDTMSDTSRGHQMYKSPLGAAVMARALGMNITVSELLRRADLKFQDLHGLVVNSHGYSNARRQRILQKLEQAGISLPAPEASE